MAVDLNELQRVILENQHRGEALPDDPVKQVVVNKKGEIALATEAKTDEPFTIVEQKTFA